MDKSSHKEEGIGIISMLSNDIEMNERSSQIISQVHYFFNFNFSVQY